MMKIMLIIVVIIKVTILFQTVGYPKFVFSTNAAKNITKKNAVTTMSELVLLRLY